MRTETEKEGGRENFHLEFMENVMLFLLLQQYVCFVSALRPLQGTALRSCKVDDDRSERGIRLGELVWEGAAEPSGPV